MIAADSGKEVHRWEGEFAFSRLEDEAFHAAEQGAGWPIAFAPDGKTLAAASERGPVRRWSLRTGKELLAPGGNEAPARTLTVSPDGRLLAAGGREGVTLWEPATGKLVRRLARPPLLPWPVNPKWPAPLSSAILFTRDGQRLAAGWLDGAVTVWDVASGKTLWCDRKHEEPVLCLAFTAGEKKLVSGAGHQLIRWDLSSGRQTQNWFLPNPDKDQRQTLTAFSPGPWLAVASRDPKNAQLWELATGKMRGELKQDVRWLRFSPDGRYLLGIGGARLVLADPATGKEVRHLVLDYELVGTAFSPDGSRVAGLGIDGSIHIWDTETAALLGWLPGHQGGAQAITFLPDGRSLATAGQDSTILVWDVARLGSRKEAPRLTGAELAALWKQLASGDAVRAGEAVARLKEASEAAPFLAEKLAGPASGDQLKPQEELQRLRAIEVLELNGGAEARAALRGLARKEPATRLTLTAEARLVRLNVFPGKTEAIPPQPLLPDQLPQGATSRLSAHRFQHRAWISHVRYLPDGKTLLSCVWDSSDDCGPISFWDAETGRQRHSLNVHLKDFSREVAPDKEQHVSITPPRYSLSPDGRFLATAEELPSAESAIVRVRNLANGETVFQVKDDRARFSFVQFAPTAPPSQRWAKGAATSGFTGQMPARNCAVSRRRQAPDSLPSWPPSRPTASGWSLWGRERSTRRCVSTMPWASGRLCCWRRNRSRSARWSSRRTASRWPLSADPAREGRPVCACGTWTAAS